MHFRQWMSALIGATVAGAVGMPAAMAGDIKLHPPQIYPVAYEHLNRWCGPDALIINGADGQALLRLDQVERGLPRFNDPIDPLVAESWSELAEAAGCLLEGEFSLTYWQVTGPLAVHRLRKMSNTRWQADIFRREEYVRLPGEFQNWTRSGNDLFLAYKRPCPAEADAQRETCVGVERIDLGTLDREAVLERHGTAAAQQSPVPDVSMLQDAGHVAAMVVDEKGTSFCRIDPATFNQDCRLALAAPVERRYYYNYRRLTLDEAGDGFYEIGERLLHCRDWTDTSDNQPMCRLFTPRLAGRPDAKLRVRAVLPGDLALIQADRCLSLGAISVATGVVQNLQCLSNAIRDAAPDDLRATLVEEEIFAEELDGVTIPGWDMSVSPGGKWIAIQVPRKGCGDDVPEPETLEPSAGIGSCGQVMVWRTDHFLWR